MQEIKVFFASNIQDIIRDIDYGKCCPVRAHVWDLSAVPSAVDYSAGWLLTARFGRPDRETGDVELGAGRPWFIARGATESAVVKTVLSALLAIAEHEIREGLLYRGRRPFDPHRTVAEMAGEQTP